MSNLNTIIKLITDSNNLYRDSTVAIKARLEALWEIGDFLYTHGVKKPHAIGWEIQRETKGLIKRPTIFRGYKIRQIWKTKNEMVGDIGGLKKISFLIEMLPLVDPKQGVRGRLSDDELKGIYKSACMHDAKVFANYLRSLKKKYAHGRLGKPLDKAKYLHEFDEIVKHFKKLQNTLLDLFKDSQNKARKLFRQNVSEEESRAFSNMCLSLTTKGNFKLYKKLNPQVSSANDENFKYSYIFFRTLLSKNNDTGRARLRRLIPAEVFAQLSDMISSIQTEDSVRDFKARQKLTIGL